MIEPVRRVVVLGDQDPPVVTDAPSPHVHSLPGMSPDLGLTDLWYTDGAKSDHAAVDGADRDLAIAPGPGGSLFRMVQLPPDDGAEPFWHETDTCDYNTLLSGELVMLYEGGEVTLHAGDTMIVRGGRHAWSNRSTAPAVLSTVAVGLVP